MYEYKVVPAPARAAKVRGLKSTGERFSHALTEVLNDLGSEGWEFLRSETLPCEERSGWFGGTRTSTQVVLVFGRALPQTRTAPAQPVLRADPPAPTVAGADGVAAREPLRAEPRTDPRPEPRPEPQRAEPVFRSGAMLRAEGERRFPPLRQPDDGPTTRSLAADDARR